jgi:hypothetical protein
MYVSGIEETTNVVGRVGCDQNGRDRDHSQQDHAKPHQAPHSAVGVHLPNPVCQERPYARNPHSSYGFLSWYTLRLSVVARF